MYLWQIKNWTDFKWDNNRIIELLANARKKHGFLLAKGNDLNLLDTAEFITKEAVSTSGIEGENIDPNSVRSSIAKRLGLPRAGLPENTKKTDGIVDVLLDATINYSTKLDNAKLWSWHAALFPTGYSGINKIEVAQYRRGYEPMEVVSGNIGNFKIHFRAPDSLDVPKLMNEFIFWWNNSNNLDGIIKAALAHLYFVTIHPFDDGNGRMARVITDMTLARDEKNNKRLYSLSGQIIKEKKEYYRILEETQKGNGDVTNWVYWFIQMFTEAVETSLISIEKAVKNNRFKERISSFNLNNRQVKVITKLLEKWPNVFKGGLTNKKYVAIAKTSPETAKRDLKILVDLNILIKSEKGGRSTSYQLKEDI